jgi:starch synthase (maltosyl-transferring)
LQEYENLRFYGADNEIVLCYGKALPDTKDWVVIVVNLDPFQAHETMFHLPIGEFGIAQDEQYRAVDLMSGETFIWTGPSQHLNLDPRGEPARIFAIERFQHVEYAEPCF